VKLAVVVQRYGTEINGGAELHARYIVELLARQHQVDVLTTCARDYVTWRNEWPAGTETVRGVPVRRFPVSRERDPDEFGWRSTQVFERLHSVADELAWVESEGPTSPALIDYLRDRAGEYDYIVFFSYRYYHAYQGVRTAPNKAILVPTAERDATIGLSIFGPIFRGVRAVMYNSPEERAMIQTATGNTHVPGVVVGVGSEVPRNPVPVRFRRKYRINDPFIIYVGRIDENKGCRELFAFFTSYRPRLGQRLKLVLIGNSILPIPDHPNVHHLGFVSDQDKFDAMSAADALVMPSYYESLSMVTLEAWALGRPVLANGRCDVLRGQCIRSRAGLYYDTFEEFAETLFTLTTNRALAEALGGNGREYFEQHYAWPVIERKYLDILKHLALEDAAGRAATPIEPLPGWLMRRRKVLPPASSVVARLPQGAVLVDSQSLTLQSVAVMATSPSGVGRVGAQTASAGTAQSSSLSSRPFAPQTSGRSEGVRREGARAGVTRPESAGPQGGRSDHGRRDRRDRPREPRQAGKPEGQGRSDRRPDEKPAGARSSTRTDKGREGRSRDAGDTRSRRTRNGRSGPRGGR
jgi:glycosyltransferase involved in cell wall biosynthesis